ncbi:MAG: c-type cytochrome [Ardenticatenales bacterium]|nr:c-type cytochrome [Ardenticatenales bacterium]
MNMSVVWLVVAAAALAGVAFWAARRAWKVENPWGRWIGAIVGWLVAVAAALAAVVLMAGLYRLRSQDDHPISDIEVEASAEAIARGALLAEACAGCHSSTGDPPLDGGEDNFLEGLGDLYPPNLTPGGPLADRSDGRIARAIREGVGIDGRPLIIMPSAFFHSMSDEDTAAIIAYLRTEPEIDEDVPERVIGPMGTLLIGAGMFPLAVQEPIEDEIDPPDTDSPKKWGKYLTTIMACAECHGEDLQGRDGGNGPSGPDLTVYAEEWTAKEWRDTIRTGVDPTDNEIDPDEMPWEDYSAALSDDELDAIQAYIASLPTPDED